MAISLPVARKLCTASEYELVRYAMAGELPKLTAGRLKQKISRSRELRNKFRDLAKQQKGEARGKRSPRGARPSQGAGNTKKKAALFADVLERFEKQLAKIEAQEAQQAAAVAAEAMKKRPGMMKKPSVPPPAKNSLLAAAQIEAVNKSLQKHHKSSVLGRKQSRLARTSAHKIKGHVSASGRRKQARRDSRG